MMKSLRFRLVVVNALAILLVMVGLAALQVSQTQRVATQVLDEILLRRAQMVAGPGRGPGGGEGTPPWMREQAQGGQPGNPRFNGGPGGFNGEQGPGNPQGPPVNEGERRNARRQPPELQGGPVRIMGADGRVLGPRGQTEPLDRRQFELAKASRNPLFVSTTINGVSYRLLSLQQRGPNDEVLIVQIAQENGSFALLEQVQLQTWLWLLPGVGLISGLAAWLLSRQVLRPVAQMAEAARAISQNPDHLVPMPATGPDEMGDLGRSLDTMTRRLQDAKRTTEHALEQQRRFSSDAAHELRTPLTGIVLASENGLHPQATPEEKDQALERVLRLAEGMNRLTAMLLQLSRMDQSGNALTLAPVPLAPIVAEAVRAAGLENDPRVHIESLPESVVTQPDALVQLLRNLLENAAAYTPAEGRITVDGEASELRVKDTGAGIAAEHLPHLFERFYRADPSRARTSGGYGLGLSIAQGLAQAMRAQLRVESELGSGTTFFINFSGTDVSS